jgi:hypothetical protein
MPALPFKTSSPLLHHQAGAKGDKPGRARQKKEEKSMTPPFTAANSERNVPLCLPRGSHLTLLACRTGFWGWKRHSPSSQRAVYQRHPCPCRAIDIPSPRGGTCYPAFQTCRVGHVCRSRESSHPPQHIIPFRAIRIHWRQHDALSLR